jgi:hypothetical protein
VNECDIGDHTMSWDDYTRTYGAREGAREGAGETEVGRMGSWSVWEDGEDQELDGGDEVSLLGEDDGEGTTSPWWEVAFAE